MQIPWIIGLLLYIFLINPIKGFIGILQHKERA